jgi:hypothetical protein
MDLSNFIFWFSIVVAICVIVWPLQLLSSMMTLSKRSTASLYIMSINHSCFLRRKIVGHPKITTIFTVSIL